MVGGTHIRNETGLERVLAGTEAYPGQVAVPDYAWKGLLRVNESSPLMRDPEMTGGYDQLVTPRKEFPTFDGTFSQRLSFQEFTFHNQYAIKEGAAGVADGAGWIHSKSPNSNADDIATATLEYGNEGQVWRSSAVSHNEYTISIDTDSAANAWEMNSSLFVRDKEQVIAVGEVAITAATGSTLTVAGAAWTVDAYAGHWVFVDFGTGTGQVRQIQSNTATVLTLYGPALSPVPTAGDIIRVEDNFSATVANTIYDTIPVAGTKLFLDPVGGTLGSTQIMDRFISGNITVNNSRTGKRFAENRTAWSARTGRGMRLITGQVRMEFDRRDEYQQYKDMSEMAIRFYQEGPLVASGQPMWARIDVPRALWDVVDRDERENNITATFGFVAFAPASDPIATFAAKHDIQTLP